MQKLDFLQIYGLGKGLYSLIFISTGDNMISRRCIEQEIDKKLPTFALIHLFDENNVMLLPGRVSKYECELFMDYLAKVLNAV